jgi:hypothetical protein
MRTRGKQARALNGKTSYDSESKAYRIYWPEKRSKSAIVHGEAQSEGERDETIQASQKNVDVEEIDKEPETEQTRRQSKPENGVETHRTPEPAINIPTYEANPELELPTPDDDSSFNPEYGRGKGARRRKRDRKPIGVQPSEQRFRDPIVDIHILRKLQIDELTSNGFLTFSPKRNQSCSNSDSDYKHCFYGFFNQHRRQYRYRRKTLTENRTNRCQTGIEVMGERNNRNPIALARDKRFYTTTKHSDLRYHFIREAVEERSRLSTYQSSRTIADIFSKSLARSRHQKIVAKLELRRREEKGVG